MYSALSTIQWKDVARKPALVTAPTQEPISIEGAKEFLRIDISDEDDLIGELISTARRFVEEDAEIALLTSTWALYLDCFPAWEIELRKLPVQSISSVVYLDTTGASTTLSASLYRLDSKNKPARLTPAYGQYWPSTYDVTNAVTITFVAGETSRDTVDDIAKQAMRHLIAHWYKNREAVMTTGAVPFEIRLAYEACIARLAWSGGL